MKIDRKHLLELGFIALAAIALFFVFFRGRNVAPAATQDASGNTAIEPGRAFGSEYYIYNYPQIEGPPSGNINPANSAVVSQTTGGPLPTCGCAGGTQGEFPSVTRFANYLSDQLSGFVQSYQDNVLSTVPDWFGQYINNSTGAALSRSAATFFSG